MLKAQLLQKRVPEKKGDGIQLLILNKCGIPLFYHCSHDKNEDYLWLSSFFTAIRFIAKTMEDKITQVIGTKTRYLVYDTAKFIAILGINVEVDAKIWRTCLKEIAVLFEKRYNSRLDEIGGFQGKLGYFDSFIIEFQEKINKFYSRALEKKKRNDEK
ncbi:MAG: hypothetical protein ACTSYO_05105 [Candidatus Ranarchaeia archaeon]